MAFVTAGQKSIGASATTSGLFDSVRETLWTQPTQNTSFGLSSYLFVYINDSLNIDNTINCFILNIPPFQCLLQSMYKHDTLS
jgi:hypothetical protein